MNIIVAVSFERWDFAELAAYVLIAREGQYMRALWTVVILLLMPKMFCEELIPRKILAIYNSNNEHMSANTLTHLICEMPLNYLGLDVIYHDLQQPLPDLSNRSDIRGILTCFPYNTSMPDPVSYLDWASKAVDLGKKYVILRDPGFTRGQNNNFTPDYLVNSFYQKLGIYSHSNWNEYTFRYKIAQKNKEVVEFEHPYPFPLPPFGTMEIVGSNVKSFLTVESIDDPSDKTELVIIGPNGGYVSEYYASTYTQEKQAPEERYWYINPFRFFQLAFATEDLPVPDTTTLAGRRIFYSQIDGDSWNSLSDIEKYAKTRASCSEVMFEEVLTKFPHLPLSASIIAADIDPKWVGTERSQKIARKILALEHVEIATHTYSHPFDWKFFEDHDQQKKEIDYLYLYPYGSWQSSYLSWLRTAFYLQKGQIATNENSLGFGFVTPRAYANHPFNLQNEIEGSCRFIEQFAPPGKKVKLIQWTGDCKPWAAPIQLSRSLGLRNLNGGNIQKDYDHPSYCNVGPLGRHVGEEIQIYSSANNENVYTYEWKDRFFGFKYVVETFHNTGHPLRIKPIDLYYHFYSAERTASLNALLSDLAYIEKQEIIPVWPSRYGAVADGFYTTKVISLGANLWKIKDHQGLATIRFDNPRLSVQYGRSKGVVGHRLEANVLYVYLDGQIAEPIIELSENEDKAFASLVESRWEVWDLKRQNDSIQFLTKGWGELQMQWRWPLGKNAILQAKDEEGNVYEVDGVSQHEGIQSFTLNALPNRLLMVTIK